MPMYITRSPHWNFVKDAPILKTKCPRCNNEGEFRLAWDGVKGLFGMWWSWRVAVYHCPICPYYQEVPVKSVEHLLG